MKRMTEILALGMALLTGCHSPSLSQYRDHAAFNWQRSNTDHFVIYFEHGSTAETHVETLAENLEISLTNILTFLEIRSSDYGAKPIHVFLVESHEKMAVLMGSRPWGGALPRIRVIFAVMNGRGNGCSPHEVCHVVANNFWGKPERWLDEGLSSYVDLRSRARNIPASGQMLDQGKLPTLPLLSRDFGRFSEEIGYAAAGSYVQFVHERYGTEKLQEVWRGGFHATPRILGTTPSALEEQWRAFVRQHATSRP